MRIFMRFIGIIFFLYCAQNALAQIPKIISYQGVLTDTSGVPKADWTYSFTFRFYAVSSGGTALWSEQKTLLVQRGLFSTNLGDQVVFPPSLAFDREYWLGIQLANNPEMTPRIPLTASGYSISSLRADTARVALAAPVQASVDSARIAGTVPDNSLSAGKIRSGEVVKSLNGLHDGVEVVGESGLYALLQGDNKIHVGLELPYNGSALAIVPVFTVANTFTGSAKPTFAAFTASVAAPSALFNKGTNSSTLTNAAVQVENFARNGEGVWLRNSSSANAASVLKLHRHPLSASHFIEGFNWDGVGNPVRKFNIDGNGTYTAGGDFAESFEVSGAKASYEPGDVVVLSDHNERTVEKGSIPYDTKVVGVYSTRPGVLGAEKSGATQINENEIPVAIVGIVPTKVTTENGAIHAGDLLTTSSSPGYAMKASAVDVNGMKIYPFGSIVGKAIEPMTAGKGVINVLVNIR